MKALAQTGYIKLLKDVREIIEEGKKRTSEAAGKELLTTYWQVGKRICDEGVLENAVYGDSVLDDLSDGLQIDLSTLKRCVYFFQTYPSVPSYANLSWSHYKFLITLRDNKERNWYESLADEGNFNYRQLGKAIKEDKFEEYQESKSKKTTSKKKIKRPREPTYIYKAIVERVIDGDTLLLRFDLGFTVWKEQRIRLAGMDAPAMDEPKGKEALRFVQGQLAKAPFVMVKTNKIDIYGRYVGHVFYSFKNKSKEKIFQEGYYLNQEILDKGLAKIL